MTEMITLRPSLYEVTLRSTNANVPCDCTLQFKLGPTDKRTRVTRSWVVMTINDVEVHRFDTERLVEYDQMMRAAKLVLGKMNPSLPLDDGQLKDIMTIIELLTRM